MFSLFIYDMLIVSVLILSNFLDEIWSEDLLLIKRRVDNMMLGLKLVDDIDCLRYLVNGYVEFCTVVDDL